MINIIDKTGAMTKESICFTVHNILKESMSYNYLWRVYILVSNNCPNLRESFVVLNGLNK